MGSNISPYFKYDVILVYSAIVGELTSSLYLLVKSHILWDGHYGTNIYVILFVKIKKSDW